MARPMLYRPNRYRRATQKATKDLEIETPKQKSEDCDYGLCISPSDWYQRAQIAYQRSVLQIPPEILRDGRQNEWEMLEQFWTDNVKSIPKKSASTEDSAHIGKSIYISGPPGTGKSVLVSAFVESKKPLPSRIHLIQVNCMTLKEPKRLQKHLIDQWNVTSKRKSSKRNNIKDQEAVQSDSMQARQAQLQQWESLKSIFMTSNDTYILVLDEMDQLIQSGPASFSSNYSNSCADQQPSFLYHLFELSQSPNSRFILMGIANAIDLMHHWVPKFNANQLPVPKQCHFSPFSIEQTMVLLKNRIRISVSSDNDSHSSQCSKKHQGFHPIALELCARKVASMGDFRKALDLCKLTIERAEKDYFEVLLSETHPVKFSSFSSSQGKENMASGDMTVTCDGKPLDYLVKLHHVQQAITMIFGNPLVQAMVDLNLHHQLVLISIYLISKHENQESLFPLVLQKYVQLCQMDHIQLTPLTRTEFHDSLTLLEGKGLVLMKRGSTSMLSSSTVSMKRKKSGSFGGGEGVMIKHMETRMALKCHESDLIKGLSHVPMLSSLIQESDENK